MISGITRPRREQRAAAFLALAHLSDDDMRALFDDGELTVIAAAAARHSRRFGGCGGLEDDTSPAGSPVTELSRRVYRLAREYPS